MSIGPRSFEALLLPLLFGASVPFVVALPVLFFAGSLTPANVASALFVSFVIALLFFLPVAFAATLVSGSWRVRSAVASSFVALFFVAGALWSARRVPVGEEAFGVIAALAVGTVMVIGQAVFVGAWARSVASSARAGAT